MKENQNQHEKRLLCLLTYFSDDEFLLFKLWIHWGNQNKLQKSQRFSSVRLTTISIQLIFNHLTFGKAKRSLTATCLWFQWMRQNIKFNLLIADKIQGNADVIIDGRQKYFFLLGTCLQMHYAKIDLEHESILIFKQKQLIDWNYLGILSFSFSLPYASSNIMQQRKSMKKEKLIFQSK